MKTLKKQIKSIALVLSILIFLQGCTVYKSANVTLDEASKTVIKAKVKTTTEILKFKHISLEDGQYYGVKKVKGEMIKVSLNENFIEKVQLKDKTLSTILSIGIPVIIVGGLLAIAASSAVVISGPIYIPLGITF